jgi:hypothetical protein
VSGTTGLEAYQDICLSIAKACGKNDRHDNGISIAAKKDERKRRSLLGRLKSERISESVTNLSHTAVRLLNKEGIIIFQVPGGERGWSDVSFAVEKLKLGFKLVDVLIDERGRKRCLVFKF